MDCCLTSLLAVMIIHSRPPFSTCTQTQYSAPFNTTSFPKSAGPTVWVDKSCSRSHRYALFSHEWGVYGRRRCTASFTCRKEINTTMDTPPSAAAMHSKACLIRAPSMPVSCGMSATIMGLRGAGRASSTAAGNSPKEEYMYIYIYIYI